MCKARRDFLGSQFRRGMLFDLTPEVELPDLTKLRSSLLALIPQDVRLTRKALRLKGLVKYFGEYNEIKDYNAAIAELLKAGKLHSSTGKTRINDDVILGRAPFKAAST